ncbi:MAG: histidine triad nucleotide-binding protein [Clostridia bacterium]|nr:histidine triad nucleotide-binding protein [Clostridia bacterium]
MSCLFCKIAAGEIPSAKVYEDELVYAFRDIAPQGPVHVLIIPKKHIESAQALTREDDALLCHMFACARKIAESEGVAKSGYRLITNVGDNAGQSVHHLHLHLIGGKTLKWDN